MKKYSSTAKVNYRRTPPRSKYWWLVLVAVIIGLAWIFPRVISGVSSVVLYPFSAVTLWIETSNGFVPEYLRSRSELLAEIDELRVQIDTESSTRNSVDRLLEENIRLRAMTNISTSSDRLVARVVSRPSKTAYDLLQINIGTKDGVQIGSPVYTGLDTVLGVVVHVTANRAFVDLFTSPGFSSTAYVIGPNVFATLEGMGGGVARVNLPQGIPLAEGQLVILPGVTSGVFGEIVWIDNPPTQPQQYGYITPPLGLSELFYVSVGKDVVQPKSEVEVDEAIRNATRERFILDSNIVSTLEQQMREAEESENEDDELSEEGSGLQTDEELETEENNATSSNDT